VKASYDALVEIFECIESFVRRLIIYTKIDQPTPVMTEVITKIMAELISILALATKQINQGKFSKSSQLIIAYVLMASILQRNMRRNY
jgi:hypothetical protein